ncbi:MAG: endonuclease/exonuclease/phosphatase family protein [Bacteroidales bacterium]|jgi:endonuclease/exonuclease/phosphatase family metal-dependent hydrolase|nr:endonuclease/exonuclease/phosphatase family protein [Bacteroidales bacterium]
MAGRRRSKNKKVKHGRSPWPFALLFRLMIIVAGVALVLSYLSVFINPSFVSFPLFFGLYFIPILLVNITLLIAGMLRRSGATWITFFTILPSLLFADMFVNWGEPNRGEEGISLKVMTYNVGMFAHKRDVGRESALGSIARFCGENNPDIICFQEFYIRDTGMIKTLFKEYPFRSSHFYKLKSGSRFGNLTLSRFPIKESGEITFKKSTNLCIYSDIDHYGRAIRIYNTHLESHSISFTSLVKRISNSEKMSEELLDVHDKMANTFKKRSRQVDTIAAHSSASEIPAIICGDFNDTPMSYTYHILSRGKEDSFRESGKGMSATYGSLWPLLRIDYVLYPSGWWAMSHRTPKEPWSDHYPVITELIIP